MKKAFLVIISEIVLMFASMKMGNNISVWLGIYFFLMGNIWIVVLFWQLNKRKISGITRNGLSGARDLAILTNALLLIYVVQIYRSVLLSLSLFLISCGYMFLNKEKVKRFFGENRFDFNTIIVFYIIVAFWVSLYGLITIVWPGLHFCQGDDITLEMNSIKYAIIVICIAIDFLTLPKNSIVAKFASSNFSNNFLYKDDVEGNKVIEEKSERI